MTQPRAAVILAAGKSTRMKSKTSKVLHHVGGRAMLEWVAAMARETGVERLVCVVGEANRDVREAAEALGMEIAVQEPQMGTGHAVQCAKSALADFEGNIAVLFADTPLIRSQTVTAVFESLEAGSDISVVGFETPEPAAYGRLITNGYELLSIVEAKEATPEQLQVQLCNSGVMAAPAGAMFSALDKVTNDNAKGEYYLTDIVEIIRGCGGKAGFVLGDEQEVMGVNSRADLAHAERAFQDGMRAQCLANGVTLRDPETVYFSYDTKISNDVEIGAHVVFGPGVSIASDSIIYPYCHIEGAVIGEGALIGPFARFRPGTELAENTKVGNFVEIKKSKVGPGSKVNHLSYVGDADIGRGVNVGAGTVTCNYDGYFKHKTTIKDGAFIGTHSSLVAPLTIGKGAFLGTGGVITDDVPDDALALARAKQENKAGWAKRFHTAMARKKSQKK